MEIDRLQKQEAGFGTLRVTPVARRIVGTVRGFVFALRCAPALRTGTCPTGIMKHNLRLQPAVPGVEDRCRRVAHDATSLDRVFDMIAYRCGMRHAREPERRHVRLVQLAGGAVALDVPWALPLAFAAKVA